MYAGAVAGGSMQNRGQRGKVNHDADSIVGRAIDLHSPKMELSRPVVDTMNAQMRLGRSIKEHFALRVESHQGVTPK